MAFNDTFNRLERLAFLIQRKATGSPEDLANRLEVSRRTIYNLIDILKGQGADIEYCRDRSSFYYAHPVKINFKLFSIDDDIGSIRGGRKYFINDLLSADFLPTKAASLYC